MAAHTSVMSAPSRRYRFPTGCFDVAAKPWYIDVLVAGIVVLWMGWTFTIVQEQGFNWPIIAVAAVIGMLGITFIYGQRLTYLRIGDKIVVGLDSPLSQQNGDDERQRVENQYRNE